MVFSGSVFHQQGFLWLLTVFQITDYRNAEAWISGDRSVVHPIPQCYMDHVSQHAP